MKEEVEVENGESGQDPAIENEADQEAVVMKITDAAGLYKNPGYNLQLISSPCYLWFKPSS